MQGKAGRTWVHEAFRAAALLLLDSCGSGRRTQGNTRAQSGTARWDIPVSTPAPRNGGPRKYHSSAHEGRSGNHKTSLRELEKGRSQTQNSRLGTRNFTPGGQNRRRRSPGEKTQARSTGPGTGRKGARRAGQVRGQMEPLHLAMMRALWIWTTHEMRLVASCNQVARAC